MGWTVHGSTMPMLRHVGLYPYRAWFLRRCRTFEVTQLEQIEKLDLGSSCMFYSMGQEYMCWLLNRRSAWVWTQRRNWRILAIWCRRLWNRIGCMSPRVRIWCYMICFKCLWLIINAIPPLETWERVGDATSGPPPLSYDEAKTYGESKYQRLAISDYAYQCHLTWKVQIASSRR